MQKEEFVYKFEGEKLKGLKVPCSFLKGVVNSLSRITNRVSQLDSDAKRDIDFNVEIRPGSIAICASALEGDSIGLEAIRKTSQLVNGFTTKSDSDLYFGDIIIKKNIKDLVRATYDFADSLQVIHNGINMGEKIKLNDTTLKMFELEEIRETFANHIAFLHKINSKNMTVGLTVPGQEIITANISTIFIKDLKNLFNDFIYVKIDTGAPQGTFRLMSFKELPTKTNDICQELKQPFEKSIKRLDEISMLNEKWDGYNGKEFQKYFIEKVKKFITYMCVFIKEFDLKKILPNIVPVPNGNLQFEFSINNKYLEVEFDKEDNYHILRISKIDEKEIEREFNVSNEKEVLDSIFWVLKK